MEKKMVPDNLIYLHWMRIRNEAVRSLNRNLCSNNVWDERGLTLRQTMRYYIPINTLSSGVTPVQTVNEHCSSLNASKIA